MALYKRRVVIYLVTAFSVVAAVVISRTLTPVYEAECAFTLTSNPKAVSFMSPEASEQLARSLDFPEEAEAVFESYVEVMKNKYFAKRVSASVPEREPRLLEKSVSFAINSSIIEIYVRDTDPSVASRIANSYMEHFNDYLHENSSDNLENTIALLNRQIEETRLKMEEAQARLKSFEETNKIASIEDEIKNLTAVKSTYETKLEDANIQIASMGQKISSTVKEMEKENLLYQGDQFIFTNPLIVHLQESLYELSSKIAYLTIEMKEMHPEMLALKKQYSDIEGKLKAEIDRLVKSQIKDTNAFYERLRQDLVANIIEEQRLRASRKAYAETIAAVEKRLGEFPAKRTEWTNLSSEAERYKRMHEQLNLDLEESLTQKGRKVQMLTVVYRAEPPERPSFPILPLNILVAIFAGAIAGVLYALLLDYIEKSRRIRLGKIVEEILAEK